MLQFSVFFFHFYQPGNFPEYGAPRHKGSQFFKNFKGWVKHRQPFYRKNINKFLTEFSVFREKECFNLSNLPVISTGPLGSNFNNNFLRFLRLFCPAGPLGESFHDNFTTFYANFLPRRVAWRKFFHDNIITLYLDCLPLTALSENFHDNFVTFYCLSFEVKNGYFK